jgi:FAD/FMN-containing dehydrogenase
VPNAVCFREAQYIVRVLSPLDGQDEAAVRATHQRLYDAVEPWTLGRSVTFVYGRTRPDEFVAELYDEPTLARLAEVKAAYDPRNVFRRTHNVRPAG